MINFFEIAVVMILFVWSITPRATKFFDRDSTHFAGSETSGLTDTASPQLDEPYEEGFLSEINQKIIPKNDEPYLVTRGIPNAQKYDYISIGEFETRNIKDGSSVIAMSDYRKRAS